MRQCPSCGTMLPDNARYCLQCGAALPLQREQREAPLREFKPRYRWSVFWVTLLASVAISLVLTVALGLPVFILGFFLPFIWQFRPRQQ